MIQAQFLPLILCFIIISNLSIMIATNNKKIPRTLKRFTILVSMAVAAISVLLLMLYIFD